MKTAIIAFEGVCVPDDPSKTVAELLPVPGALELVTTLSSYYNLIVHTTRAALTPADMPQAWLRQQHFPSVELMFVGGISGVVQTARRRGYDVQLVLDASPLVIAECARLGVQALLYVSPSYMRPEFRPDYDEPVRPWDQMIEEIDAVRKQRNEDSRFEIVEQQEESRA